MIPGHLWRTALQRTGGSALVDRSLLFGYGEARTKVKSRRVKRLVMPIAGACLLAVTLAACGDNNADASKTASQPSASLSTTGTASANPTAKTDSAKPADLTGTWRTAKEKEEAFKATISPNHIEIVILGDDEESESLYWVGTFPYSAGAKTVISAADTEKLDSSLLGSEDKEKTFTIDGDHIDFDFSMMGTTLHVRLGKQ